MKSAQAYNALNENQYERSRSKMTGTSGAAEAIGFADSQVKLSDDFISASEKDDDITQYYRSLAGKFGQYAFGDYESPYYQAPVFKPATPPKEIKVNYDGE